MEYCTTILGVYISFFADSFMGLVCGFVKTENKSRQVSYAIVGVLLGADYRVVSFNASSTRVDFMREFKKSKNSIQKIKKFYKNKLKLRLVHNCTFI